VGVGGGWEGRRGLSPELCDNTILLWETNIKLTVQLIHLEQPVSGARLVWGLQRRVASPREYMTMLNAREVDRHELGRGAGVRPSNRNIAPQTK